VSPPSTIWIADEIVVAYRTYLNPPSQHQSSAFLKHKFYVMSHSKEQ
jgi:hypothetical protein